MITFLTSVEWVVAALLALGAAILALKVFKVSPIWALVIGMAIFTGLQFPIQTHAVKVDMPAPAKLN